MKAQEYNLTGNEKFSVWFTTMMMMTSAQLDPDSKARIMNMAKIMCVGECLDMQKLENDDPVEMEKSKEKQKEFDAMKDAIWKEMDKITEVLTACYGEPRKGKKLHRCAHND
jgi:hypothetical protein